MSSCKSNNANLAIPNDNSVTFSPFIVQFYEQFLDQNLIRSKTWVYAPKA